MMKLKMKNLSFGALASLVIGLLIVNACVNHDIGEIEGSQPHPVDCTGKALISYEDQVADIIEENCLRSGCHGDEPSLPDWGELSNLQDADYKAEIKRRITLPDLDPDKMPRIGSLTQAERETIYCWIEQGALDN